MTYSFQTNHTWFTTKTKIYNARNQLQH